MKMRYSALAAVVLLATQAGAHAETIYATTAGNSLVKFDSATPGATVTNVVTGLAPDESVLGIDFRPATGELFALGSSSRLYTIDLVTAVATLAGTGPANAPFSPALDGDTFGFDFNPTVDRIRITSDAGQNLRANPLTGAIGGTDSVITGGTVNGSAYDRSDIDPTTGTSLFVIDSVADVLLMQGGIDGAPSPNGGVLTLIGGLSVDTSELVGFDISGATGIAYASLFNTQSLASALYTINLSTGAATLVGDTGLRLTGLAVAPAPVPLPGAVWLLGSALAGLMIKHRR